MANSTLYKNKEIKKVDTAWLLVCCTGMQIQRVFTTAVIIDEKIIKQLLLKLL